MITQIYLQNFKCFRQVEIHPKRVTCFVGANGTGKSSVLQAFGLLKQTIETVKVSPCANVLNMSCDLKLDGPLLNVSDSGILTFEVEQDNPEIYFAGTEGIVGGSPTFSYRAQIFPEKLEPLSQLHKDSIEPAYSALVKLKLVDHSVDLLFLATS